MELNLAFQPKNELGKEIGGLSLGQALAGALMREIQKDPMKIGKFYSWAMSLGENKPIKLDKEDAKMLKDFVVGNGELAVVAKAPILELLDK